MLPNFLFIGPGRAGSDWITKNLKLHPDIYIPRQKGTHFFIDKYDKGIDWYEKFFRGRSEKAIGEATVGYLHREESPKLVYKHLPNVKLISNLRDPVERAYSSYSRLTGVAKRGDTNYNLSFEEKIKLTPRILEQGLYGKHLKRWYDLFPRENILILTFDEMKKDPANFLKTIYSFLEVDPEFESPLLTQKLNSSATLGSKSRLLYNLYRALLRIDLFGASKALDKVNSTKRVEINPETRKSLIQEYFIGDIIELEGTIGRDLSSWKT